MPTSGILWIWFHPSIRYWRNNLTWNRYYGPFNTKQRGKPLKRLVFWLQTKITFFAKTIFVFPMTGFLGKWSRKSTHRQTVFTIPYGHDTSGRGNASGGICGDQVTRNVVHRWFKLLLRQRKPNFYYPILILGTVFWTTAIWHLVKQNGTISTINFLSPHGARLNLLGNGFLIWPAMSQTGTAHQIKNPFRQHCGKSKWNRWKRSSICCKIARKIKY